MNRKLAVTLIVGAFVLGIVGGWCADRYYCRQFVTYFYASNETSEADSILLTLKNLRANRITNAVELLEGRLDGCLMVLDATTDYVPKSQQDKQSKLFEKIKEYRSQFPRNTEDLEIDQAVSNVLSRAKIETGK
jgi:hypothetical protein